MKVSYLALAALILGGCSRHAETIQARSIVIVDELGQKVGSIYGSQGRAMIQLESKGYNVQLSADGRNSGLYVQKNEKEYTIVDARGVGVLNGDNVESLEAKPER